MSASSRVGATALVSVLCLILIVSVSVGAFSGLGSAEVTDSEVTLSTTEPAPGSDVTVTVTATPDSGTTGFSFTHAFNQPVESVSDRTVEVGGSTVNPGVDVANSGNQGNDPGVLVILQSADVNAGEEITIEYTITTNSTAGKTVNITGSVANEDVSTDLPDRSYTVTAQLAGGGGGDPIQVDVSPSDLPGDGTESDPYEISNVSELQAMEGDLDADYELVSDIDASDTAQFNDGRGFDPVGELGDQFTGSFEGNNQTITDLTITRPDEERVGLFGAIEGATLSNVTLENVTVTGDRDVGGLAGVNDAGTIRDAKASASVNGSENVGGLVGNNDGNVTTATASGNVVATGDSGSAGGLVGFNGGTIQNTSAFGSVKTAFDGGGLVGTHAGVIRDSFAAGEVTATDDSAFLGGLVGFNDGVSVQDSYFDQRATNQSIAADNPSNFLFGLNLTTAQMQGQAARTNMSGFDFDNTWTTTSEYPALQAPSGTNEGIGGDGGPIEVDVDPSDLSGDGIESNPYQISNVSELQAMEDDLDANYELVSDIDASDTAEFNEGAGFDPVGASPFVENNTTDLAFSGSLDGNNRTVTGLTIDRSNESRVGLIGFTDSEATIRDITLINVTITGNNTVGGVVGEHRGTLTDVTISGSVTGDTNVGGLAGESFGFTTEAPIEGATASVSVTGNTRVGGLVGFHTEGKIQNATVTASGSVTGGFVVGGLVGNSNGNVTDASASGSVTGDLTVGGLIGNNFGNITTVTASGDVTGDRRVGGLVGTNTAFSGAGTITNATASGSVSLRSGRSKETAGGLVGRNAGTITDVSASGGVTGGEFSREVGGVVGLNNGTITDASATGSVTGGASVGGLVGANGVFGGSPEDATIQSATATGSVTGTANDGSVGGLSGRNSGTLRNAAAFGNVTATGEFQPAGGLVGINDGEIRDTFAVGSVSATGESGTAGGLVGNNDGTVRQSYFDTQATNQTTSAGTATGLTTAQMQGQAATSNLSGFEFGVDWQTQTDPADYPVLISLQQGTEPEPPTATASVTFDDQTVQNGSTIVDVASATFNGSGNGDFVIVVHQSSPGEDDVVDDTDEIGNKIGSSDVLTNNTVSDVPVNLTKNLDEGGNTQLTENQTLVAMLHFANESGSGDQNFESPITRDGTPVFDQAAITVSREDSAAPGEISIGDVTVNAKKSATVDVTLDQTPEGVQTANITVSLSNETVGEIQNAQEGAISGNLFQIRDSSPNSITFRANDTGQNVQNGSGQVTLATVTINGTTAGDTSIDASVNSLVDDQGDTIRSTTDSGTLTVTAQDDNFASSDVTLSDVDPAPGSEVTVTVTATPTNGSAGFSFTHEFNQSVASASIDSTSLDSPIISVANQNGATVTASSGSFTAGEQITITYTITPEDVVGKAVSIIGSVTNGRTTELPAKSYTISASDGDRELVIQPPSQIDRGEPFSVEVRNTSGVAVSEVPVTLNLGPNTNLANRTATTNASGIAVFEMPNASTTKTEVITLTASPDGLPAYATGDELTVTGIRDPGDLSLENLSVTPTELPRNDSVTVTAEITNTNQTSLNQTLTLTTNETNTVIPTLNINTTTVAIRPETTQTVTLTGRLPTLGTQTLSINGQSAGTVTVTEITPPTPELGTPQLTLNERNSESDTGTGTNTSLPVDLPAEVNTTTDANVTVPLTNGGDEPGEFALNLTVADADPDANGDGDGDGDISLTRTRTVELNATQTQTVTFGGVTEGLSAQPAPYVVTVTATTTPTATESSRNTSLTTNLSITPSTDADDDGSFQITDTRSPARVSDGERFTVSARVGNFGANVTTDELRFAVDTDQDGSFSDETTRTQTRTLPANDSARAAFQATAPNTDSNSDSDSGQPPLTFRLSTDADTVTGNLSVISSEFTTAVSTGDPHIVSFDGVAYDFQAAGEFVLAREPTPNGTGSLIVQARQEPLAGSDSITRNTAVATVLDNTTVIIDATDPTPLQINGSAVELTGSETIAVGNGTITRTQNGNTLTITYPGQDDTAGIGDERLTVDLYDDRVDIAVSLDPDRDRPVEGIFGPADGNATNDIGLPNGTALAQPPQAEQLYGVFRQSWRVNNSTTLFAYEDDNGPETYYDPTIPAEAVSLADLDPTTRQAAEQRAVDAGLQPGTVAFRNAVLDVALTGDGSYLTSAQQQNTTAETTTIVGAPTESIVRVEPTSASLSPGGTNSLNLTLERAPEGLAGYNLTVSIGDGGSVGTESSVRVIEATAPDIFNNSVTETTIGPDNQTVEIRATDINTVVEANETDISLGTVTVAANETADVSEVPVTVSVSRIDDDSGSPIDVQTENGTVSVTEQPPLAEGLNPPTDPDNDGVFEDLNGNGRLDFNDVVVLFENLPDAETPFQDVNDNGRIDFDDIVELFKEI